MSGPAHPTPVLDAIAERAVAHLLSTWPDPQTAREIAGAIGARPGTVANVLRGASGRYGRRPFHAGRRGAGQGRPRLWHLRAPQPTEWVAALLDRGGPS